MVAVKEIAVLSCFVFVAIVNIAGSQGYEIPSNIIDQYFSKVKADLYDIQESEYNLMNDSQKLADVQKAYMAGSVDYSAVVRAQNELAKTKNQWFKKVLKYLDDTFQFENSVNGMINPNMPYYNSSSAPIPSVG